MSKKTLRVDVEHTIGDFVYLRTDLPARARILVYYLITPGPRVQYALQLGDLEPTNHYDFEISKKPPLESIPLSSQFQDDDE